MCNILLYDSLQASAVEFSVADVWAGRKCEGLWTFRQRRRGSRGESLR